MSATLNASTFRQYFGNCKMIDVPGHSFEVEVFYLEQILINTEYETDEMKIFIENRSE